MTTARRFSRVFPIPALIFLAAQTYAGDPAVLFRPAGQASSQDSGRPVTTIVVDDAVILFRDAVGFFTAPLSFGRTDIDRLVAGAGATAVLMAMDEPLNDLMIGNPPPDALDGALDWGDRWGELRMMQYASLGLYAGGLALGEDGVRVTGRLMGEALLLAGIPAITLQYVLGRSRPYSGKGAFDYNFFEWSNQYQSLPSGHMTVAFAMSTVLAKRIDRWWASVPLYGSAGLTALSLAWGNQHWVSDIFVGAALGYLAGSYVVGREEARAAGKEGDRQTGMAGRISAGVGPGGLTLVYTF